MTTAGWAPPLAPVGGAGIVFKAAFWLLQSNRSVQILLFLNEAGYLNYIEIDCAYNNYPVPDPPCLEAEPFYVSTLTCLLEDV